MKNQDSLSVIHCTACGHVFEVVKPHMPPRFCLHCGRTLPIFSNASHTYTEDKKLLSDRYRLIKSIGRGGMGEVYLAFDQKCGRRIALKKIREDLQDHPHVRRRFLKEAYITSQLMHPAIIPIYSIQTQGANIYYTMPFVEGETLKQVIRKTRQQEKKGESLNHIGGSIPALMRIFVTICQAVAYAHTKGILHRDLKPENIIIGKYGEVLILDWGLAKSDHAQSLDDDEQLPSFNPKSCITRLGKVVGTVAYMAPERALGLNATKQTDIYALGAILYQLLTLKNPFSRGSLEEFRKNVDKEELLDPIIAAPYRDISKILSQITTKCLSPNPQDRFKTVDLLIQDIENYMEGRSDWFHIAHLDIHQKNDWEFQENVLIAEPIALTHFSEKVEWVNLMISRLSFAGNIRIDFSICLEASSSGIGILFSVPESTERRSITDGYCLWLSSEKEKCTKLLRSGVEVFQAPDIFLKEKRSASVRIEKIEKSIHLYIDDILQCSYIAHFPLIGTHVGLLAKDADFQIDSLHIYVGSLNLTVNCLAIPDAFLAQRDYCQALSEYRRIAYSFPDRAEGREAIFRSGLTLIEKSKVKNADKDASLELALKEFEKLHNTVGGPLEYLGKALVYQETGEEEEEIKCYELAYRKYPSHPQLPILQEQIISRLHEVSKKERILAYRFVLLASRHLFAGSIDAHTSRLLSSLQKHSEHLPFIEEPKNHEMGESALQHIALVTAFWLAKPYMICEIMDQMHVSEKVSLEEVTNGCCCLLELGALKEAKTRLHLAAEKEKIPNLLLSTTEVMIESHSISLDTLLSQLLSLCGETLPFSVRRALLYLLDRSLDAGRQDLVYLATDSTKKFALNEETMFQIDLKVIWANLLDKNIIRLQDIFAHFSPTQLSSESSLLHFLYGCYLALTKGFETALAHFSPILETPYPKSWTLASHALKYNFLSSGWYESSFLYEKRQLYRQLSLFYHCLGDKALKDEFFYLYRKTEVV